jgi:predicted NodU family carbamoyl transferase
MWLRHTGDATCKICPVSNEENFLHRINERYEFRPEQASRVPAVVHVVGTGRVQTDFRWFPESSVILMEPLPATGSQ